MLVTIDPGVNTGIALWVEKKLFAVYSVRTKKDSIPERVIDLTSKLDSIVLPFIIDKVIIESVAFYATNNKSMVSAQRGDLFFLSYIIGAYIKTLSKYTDNITLIPANRWKGQLTKEATLLRVKNSVDNFHVYNIKNNHEIDAVGIGLSHFGAL